MACPCMRCKYQIMRKRRICNDHVRDCGIFPMERLQNLRFQSYNQGSDNTPQALHDIAPVRPSQRRRQSSESNQAIPESTADVPESISLEEAGMEDMLDAVYGLEDPTFQIEDGLGGVNEDGLDPMEQGQNIPQRRMHTEEEVMRKLARLPLYPRAKISVLRACLAMLNLQSIFGWSDTSVSQLFK